MFGKRHRLTRRQQSCKSKPEGLRQLVCSPGPSCSLLRRQGCLKVVWHGSAYFWAVDLLDCERAKRTVGTVVNSLSSAALWTLTLTSQGHLRMLHVAAPIARWPGRRLSVHRLWGDYCYLLLLFGPQDWLLKTHIRGCCMRPHQRRGACAARQRHFGNYCCLLLLSGPQD